MRQDFAQLESDFKRLFDMVSKLSKRQSLADGREKLRAAAEPVDDRQGNLLSKDDLRRKYLHNRTHAEVARLAMKGELQ